MTSPAAKTSASAFDYETPGVFRNYSSNVPHLQSWIDNLIECSESSSQQQSSPSTDTVVQSLQRYDVVYKELLRQTRIFSEPLTQMFTQLWTGVLKLLMYMIKSYHRYVKQTSHLQNQATNLLTERQRGEAAHKIQREEFELERTALRAQIRNLESEVESLRLSKRYMENENNKLRGIIDTYLNCADFNDPVWDIMNGDDQFRSERKKSTMAADGAEIHGGDAGFRRKDVLDAGKMQLKSLNRLDIEVNEILTGILKEENRQRLLMNDLMKLVSRSEASVSQQDCSGTAETLDFKRSQKNIKSNSGISNKGDFGRDMGIQVDGKDEYNLRLDRTDDHHSIDVHQLGVAPLAPAHVFIPGLDQPYALRQLMSSFPLVLRIPPVAWTCQTILSIYLDKLQADTERIGKGLAKLSLPQHICDYFERIMGIKSAADVQIAQLMKACESHIRKQPRIALFASQIGLLKKSEMPSMDVRDTDFILEVLQALLHHGELQSDVNKSSKKKTTHQLSNFVRPDILRLSAVHVVHDIFEKWLPDGGEDYIIKVKSMQPSELGTRYVDLDLFIETLIEPWHVVRSNWEEHAKYLFKEFCSTFRILQEATFANDEGAIAADTILAEIAKQHATDCTRRPLRLFQRNEGDDNHGSIAVNNSKEPVCEMINRKKFVECIKLIVPSMSMKEIDAMYDEALDVAHESVLRVLDQMWLRFLDQASNYSSHLTGIPAKPATDKEIAEAVPYDHISKSSAHRHMGTNREFWVNQRTSISQWSRPYFARTFRTQDVEIDVFVQILIRKDIFPRSPFLEVLNIPPKDLWPNADMFYKQIKERKKKETRGHEFPKSR